MNQIFSKKNLPLLVALAIPLLMVLGLAAAVYLPSLGKSPTYNFLYVSGSGVAYPGYKDYVYAVKDGRLVKQVLAPTDSPPYYKVQPEESQLYIYDVKTNLSHEISFEEAAKLNLDPSNESPDGYQVARGGYTGGFLFFDGRSDYEHWYLKGHNRSRQLNLKLVGSGYYDNFKFLGWIK